MRATVVDDHVHLSPLLAKYRNKPIEEWIVGILQLSLGRVLPMIEGQISNGIPRVHARAVIRVPGEITGVENGVDDPVNLHANYFLVRIVRMRRMAGDE